MKIEEFIEKFAEALDDMDATSLNADTYFKELDEWSSLAALSIIAMIDDEYDVTVKAEDIRNSDTIEDLFNIVNVKNN